MASEIDKFANQAYEILYGHETVGDVTKIEAADVPDHDLLVGGFPCQAFSVAGKRLGFEDTRGTLFFEMARIAEEQEYSWEDEFRIRREEQEVRPVLTPDRMEKRQNGRRFKENDEESFTLTVQDRHGVAIREATKQGYAIAEEGDAVNIQFPGSKTRRGRVGKQIAQTLEASGINQGVVEKKERNTAIQKNRYRIRKLTPLECLRLQGFSDDVFDKLVANGISNSQLYRMAGNAVTVNVIDAIGKRLLPLIKRTK